MSYLSIVKKLVNHTYSEETESRHNRPPRWKLLQFVILSLGASLMLAALVAFSGCSTTPQAAAAPNEPAVTLSSTLTVPSTSTPQPSANTPQVTTSNSSADLLKNGEQLYQKTAGNVGCAGCHGADAKGGLGPDVRGKSASEIKSALENVNAMKFIKLSDDEINSLAAYLQSLGSK